MKKFCYEVSEREDGDGYLYVVFTEHGDEYVIVASGHMETIAEVFTSMQSVTERNL